MEKLEVLKEKIKNVNIAFTEFEHFIKSEEHYRITKEHIEWKRNKLIKALAELVTASSSPNSNAIPLCDITVTKAITTAELAAMIDANTSNAYNDKN